MTNGEGIECLPKAFYGVNLSMHMLAFSGSASSAVCHRHWRILYGCKVAACSARYASVAESWRNKRNKGKTLVHLKKLHARFGD